jgi:hypothetical protein
MTLAMNKKTSFQDGNGARIEMLGGTVLSVAAHGDGQAKSPVATGQQFAEARLERRAPRDEVWVRGIVREVAPPNFKVQGIPVTTSESTEFPGLDAGQFFLLLTPGRVVKVQGALVNNQLVAREVEFEIFEGDGPGIV